MKKELIVICIWRLIRGFSCLFVAADTTIKTLDNSTAVGLSWLENDTCSKIHDVPSSLKCKFVKNVTNCQPDDSLINYFVFTYCWMPHNLIPLSACLLFVWLLYLFVFLGATAEDYFCPALKVMSDNLRLNQNLAGVTLLALGNGAPDIFGAYAAITQAKQGGTELAIGAIFGAGIFVTTIVVGSIVFSSTFTVTKRPFLRDVIFYIIAVFCSFYVLWDQRMYWWEGAGFVVIYVVYVFVVLLGRLVYKKFLKKQLRREDIPRVAIPPEGKELEDPASFANNGIRNMDADYNSQLSDSLLTPRGSNRGLPVLQEETEQSEDDNQDKQISSIADLDCDQGSQITESQQNVDQDQTQSTDNENTTKASSDLSRATVIPQDNSRNIQRTFSGALKVYGAVGKSVVVQSSPHIQRRHHPNVSSQESNIAETTPLLLTHSNNIQTTPLLLTHSNNIQRKEHPVVKMLRGLLPIDCNSFKRQTIWWKIITIIKIPISMLLAATVPVVDDSEKDHSWNKWLNICHCVISPCFIVLITKVGLIKIVGVVPLVVITAALGLLAAVIVALSSKNDCPPRYHFVFAWLGFVTAIVWIYCLANEIVSVLQVLGVIVNLTHTVLGLTLLAWGNSIGDAISNYTMAKQGLPRIGIGACFGGPLLSMLIGIGVPSIVEAVKVGGYFKIEFTDVELICISSLLMSLLFSLVMVTLVLRFKMHRYYGLCLIFLYICFMVMALLAGTKVIKLKH